MLWFCGFVSHALPTPSPASRSGLFPVTRWTQVSRLRVDPESAEGQRALGDLCQAYWYPLYAFARRKGQSQADAQDLAQAFFAKVLQGNFFASAQAGDGRMRTYLLTAFTRHMADEWDKSQAKKRGGGVEVLSLDFEDGERRFQDEPASAESHERDFERAWARSVLSQAGAALEKECAGAGKGSLFAAISPLITGEGDAAVYEELTQSTGMTVEALRQTVRRLRLRFRDLLRETIADTLDEPTEAQIDAELQVLRAVMTS